VKHLDGVEEANINFGAAKLTVFGHAEIGDLEKAGAFDNIRLSPEKEKRLAQPEVPFWKRYVTLEISILLLIAGYFTERFAFFFFAAAIITGGYSLFKAGLQNLIRLQFDMKTLMTIAIIGAAVIGQWSEGAVVVILFAISEVLEGFSMEKARASIRSMMELSPQEATILRKGQEILLPVDEIKIGDLMVVKPGQQIAMDGIVVEGTSTVNQAAITGESVPVEKASNDEVFAGTLNENGFLKIKVTKFAEDTKIAKIIHLVEEAQGEKAPSQRFVDRFARYYTPVIIVIAILVAVVPPLMLGASWKEWIYQGLAVLVVGCPCALVISTPVSIVTAIGNAARNGVLIKGGNYLEEAGALQAIAFDKTGTLTKGLPVVTDFINYSKDSQLLSIVAALESRSQHPLASAILKETEKVLDVPVEEFVSFTGKGVSGKINDIVYFVGNSRFFKNIPYDISAKIAELQSLGKTVMIIGTEKEVLALVAVADEVREESREVVGQLRELGIRKTILLTGDNRKTAAAIGGAVQVTDIQAELLPEDKLTAIKRLKTEYGRVAMVGDGVNDAPALAAATVGIAMGGAGTDTALETADIALMNDDLKKLPFTIKLSRKTLQIIKQNIAFSIGIKILALLLVVPGWLTLWIAIFADMGTTLLVTLNGLRLLRVKD
jgi:Cd2+/Zn2+-exporting ATPase